ncbi:hypothetical protein N7497_010436 [Penicillium chrysogenum]|nr:hypothetical protein N7497_010436 [Penicillium chrysogenum]
MYNPYSRLLGHQSMEEIRPDQVGQQSFKFCFEKRVESGFYGMKQKRMCIIRESNTGLVDGNDEFYH